MNTISHEIIMTPALHSVSSDIAPKMGWNPDNWSEVERRFTSEIFINSAGKFGAPDDIGRMVASAGGDGERFPPRLAPRP